MVLVLLIVPNTVLAIYRLQGNPAPTDMRGTSGQSLSYDHFV